MRRTFLQDRLAWASNRCARAAGDWADAYRPRGPDTPLAAANRFLRLPALFTGMHGSFSKPLAYGDALAHGIFDTAYTRVGDYVVQDGNAWFIASQERLQPALCVRTDRVVTISRAQAPSGAGVSGYGGVTAAALSPLITGWPASLTAMPKTGESSAALPSDQGVPYWTVLLPPLPGVTLLPSDILSDDLGRSAVVSSAESTALGWRLLVKQAIT